MRRVAILASAVLVLACSDDSRPAAAPSGPPTPPTSTRPTAPTESQEEPLPLPARPFRSGDVLDAAEITIEGDQVGDPAFGYATAAPLNLVAPLPRGCRVVKRTRNVMSLRCPGDYGAVFGFYTRLTAPYEVTRRRFGGQFDEYGRIGVFRSQAAQVLTIDVGKGDHASLGIRTGGVPLRVRGEPVGPIGEDPELPSFADGTDRFLRAFGAYRCGSTPVAVNVRSVVWRHGEVETECRNLALSPATEAGAVRVICGNIAGRESDLGARAARYRGEGFVLRGIGPNAEIDGQRCTADVAR